MRWQLLREEQVELEGPQPMLLELLLAFTGMPNAEEQPESC
jgi:hypothetical protein